MVAGRPFAIMGVSYGLCLTSSSLAQSPVYNKLKVCRGRVFDVSACCSIEMYMFRSHPSNRGTGTYPAA